MSERSKNPSIRDERETALWVVRCQLGEPGAIDELVDRWHGRLWTYLRRALAEPAAAEDAIQDTWVRILRALPRLRQPERFGPWAHRIARRVIVDRLRGRYAEPVRDGQDPDTLASREVDWDLGEDLERLRVAVDQLPFPEREAVTLYYLHEGAVRDVAAIVGVPAGTVKSRLHRARRLLRERLDAPSPGDTP